MPARKRRSARERERLFLLHGGVCHFCGQPIDPVRQGWDLSHVIPWELTRDDSDENVQPAHRDPCHQQHTAKVDQPRIAKAKRQRAAYVGSKARRGPAMPGSRDSRWRKRLNGTVERRR